MKKINELFEENNLSLNEKNLWGSAKFSVHPYGPLYDKLLESYRLKPIKLLEIGIYHGGSAILWNHYFPNGDITLVDIELRNAEQNIKDKVDSDRVRLLKQDAYDPDFVKSLPFFDIINDDGPHSLESQIKCIELYYEKLNPGGILIIEDVQSDSWYDELKKHSPVGSKHEWYNLTNSGGSVDSKVFVLWK